MLNKLQETVISSIAKTNWNEWCDLVTVLSELNMDETKITSRLLEDYALSVFNESIKTISSQDTNEINRFRILRFVCEECARIVGEYENPKWNVSKKSYDWIKLMSDEIFDRINDEILSE